MKPNRDLCIMACVFCKEPLFQEWVRQQAAAAGLLIHGASRVARGEQEAKAYILQACGVTSRNDLDRVPAAAALFHKLIREPFLAWKEAR